MRLGHPASCFCCGAWARRRFLMAAGVGIAGLALTPRRSLADDSAPAIPYDSVRDFLHLPRDLYFGEVSGVALNSKGHVFVLSRGNTAGPAYAAAATQLLEFAPDGRFAHTVKVDPHDNIWVTDKGSDMVIKFTPDGRVAMVFARKQEASDEEAGPLKHPTPPLPAEPGRFRQVTDVAWDAAVSDGYINSRVAKVDKDGNWIKSWGDRGAGPGQFHTPHSIAVDAKGLVYVADRSNRRIQVFDGDGNFQREFTIDVPVPPGAQPGNRQCAGRRGDCRRYHGAGLALGDLHLARAEPRALQLGRLSRPHLQADARRQAPGRPRPVRQGAEAVRLDPRNGLSRAERAVRRRAAEPARAEAPTARVVVAEVPPWQPSPSSTSF